ncbi:DUF3558 domain-containing protein [Saccharopolyspora kobensis]|uniref:DUF3558 domain-containing protein n=1 Tax=Saccharopolyspora kobensis TaxID=146035 RepID=UPI0015A65142|nr:DUF3558 domain-containing protein [Saccharopolyspora kobensis]
MTATGLLFLSLAGCGSATSGQPVPSTAGQTTTVDDPFKVDNPRNLAAISDPCQLLSPEQLQQLGATSPVPDRSPWGQGTCRWNNEQLSLNLAPDTVQRQGLKYTAKIFGDEQGNPTAEIDGYPAVHAGVSDLACTTAVGVSETEMFNVQFTAGSEGRNNPEFSDPCAVSDRVAGMVLANLPAG